jgi:hypothetical protein
MTKKLQNNNCSEKYNNRFQTFDLGSAASLITAGFELIELDKTNPRKVQFIFRRTIDIEKVVDNYWDDKLNVSARAFFDNIKMLKNRIYSE